MYGPDAKSRAGWNWLQAVLDYNHDDYYRAHVPGCRCPDLSASPYLQPIPSFPLTVTVKGKGSVSPRIGATDDKPCTSTCALSYLRSSSVTLWANPVAGNRFVAWGGSCSGRSICQLTMTGATSVTATFSAKPRPKPTYRKGQKSTKKHPCVRR
jgi:hypothetical protein